MCQLRFESLELPVEFAVDDNEKNDASQNDDDHDAGDRAGFRSGRSQSVRIADFLRNQGSLGVPIERSRDSTVVT